MSYVQSVLQITNMLRDRGIGVTFAAHTGTSIIALARNLMVDNFLKATKDSHMLFVDADMSFRAEDVMHMLAVDADVVGALYPRKALDWPRIARAARQHPEWTDELARVGGRYENHVALDPAAPIALGRPFAVETIGTGLMLISRAILLRMQAQHPGRVIRHGPHTDVHVFFETRLNDAGEFLGEDVQFCRHVRQSGGAIMGCPWFRVGHVGNHEFIGDPLAIARVGAVSTHETE